MIGRIHSIHAAAALLVVGVGHPAWAQDAEHGLELANQWCNACHSIGTEEPRQEDAGPIWSELAEREPQELREALETPHDFMPDFPTLSESDKEDLVAYIKTLAESES
jgi:mono/diheme cytochrome c family protein